MRSRRSGDAFLLADGRKAVGLGRLGWIGLLLAAVGWALLLARTLLAEAVLAKAPLALGLAFKSDDGQIARCLIESGFALAVLGCLQNGFGVLNNFFDTVLTRSNRRAAQPVAADEHEAGQRPYRTFPDGTVEVETILGTRRFMSMAQAREFI